MGFIPERLMMMAMMMTMMITTVQNNQTAKGFMIIYLLVFQFNCVYSKV